MRSSFFVFFSTLTLLLSPAASRAWDYEGHHAVNELALRALPANFPAFALTAEARERIAYYSDEPDRWRNLPDLALHHVNGPDHYIDFEQIYDCGLTPATLPPLRYDFVVVLANARAAHPDRFPQIDPAQNADQTRQLIGFLPWTIAEQYAKLKSGFSTLQALQTAGGRPEEIADTEAAIIYTMGVMGHYVGDASQPLHTTIHFNGWVGPNPHQYTTKHTFHQWIDGGYFNKTGGINVAGLAAALQPARQLPNADKDDGIFRVAVDFVVTNNALVEPLYQMEKNGQLTGRDEQGRTGRKLLDGQLVKSGQLLADLWYTAWQQAPEDTYLKRQLLRRDSAGHPAKANP